MSHEAALPKESEAQRIGQRANKCFSARHPETWRARSLEGTDDVGLDYHVQLVDGERYVAAFHVQLKGSESPAINVSGEFYSISLSRSTVNYYARVTEPILLVYCDLSVDLKSAPACPAFYVWIHEELKRFRKDGRDKSESDSLTVRVPVANQLTEETDLRADVDANLRLHKVATTLDEVVEAKLPSAAPDERATLLEGVATGLAQYSGTLLEVMASPVTTPWPTAPRDSIAGKLDEVGRRLAIGAIDKASVLLETLEPYFDGMTPLEKAEYLYCRGRLHSRSSDETQATADYALACRHSGDAPRYLTAWVEAELSLRYQPEKQCDVSDLKARLQTDAPDVKATLARLMAIEGDFDGAAELLDTLPRRDALNTRAIVAGLEGKHEEVVRVCDEGIAQKQLDLHSQQLFHILRARANFRLSMPSTREVVGEIFIASMTGPADLDVTRLQAVWNDVQTAIDLLRRAGWSGNLEFLADIWAAAALMLGRAEETIDAAKEAAEARPTLPTMQWALEMLAIHLEDYDAALLANQRRPDSAERIFKRIGILHQTKRYRPCLEEVEGACDSLPQDHDLYPVSLALGVLSGDTLFLADRAEALATRLRSKPQWASHVAILGYFRATARNVLAKDEALKRLMVDYEEQGKPKAIAFQLFHLLDATKHNEAEFCIDISARIRELQQLSIEGEFVLAQAYATLAKWDDLLFVANRAIERFAHIGRFSAIKAFALDKLGRTAEALTEVRKLLDSNVSDRLAVDTYVNIVTRCGFIDEALELAERLLDQEVDRARRVDCLRLLFTLLHTKEPGSQRAIEVAWEMGRNVDQNDEVAEGQFLGTFLTATIRGDVPFSPERAAEFQRRMTAFTDRWPESRILRHGTLPENPTFHDIERMLKEVLGNYEERRAWQTKTERELGRGDLPIPYAWRPRAILVNVRDIGELWEIGKKSKKDALQYHLSMIAGTWTPRARHDVATAVPLLDLTALFVLQDLELFDVLFEIFPVIAISQATLLEIQQSASPITGSFVRQRYTKLIEELKRRFEKIQQPVNHTPAEESGPIGRLLTEDTRSLAQLGRYWIYSDDALLRIYATESEETAARGLCTLDLLAIADEMGLMTPQQVSEKLGLLCSWNVGIAITPRYLLASLPTNAGEAKSASSAIDAIRGSDTCTAIFEGIWNVRKPYIDIAAHASALLADLIAEKENNLTAISAIVGLWLGKARLRVDAGETTPIQRLALLVATAARQSKKITQDMARRFWAVYNAVTEFEHGDRMDEQREREAIETMAHCCAGIDHVAQKSEAASRSRDAMLSGLTGGTADYERFNEAYTRALINLRSTRSKSFP
ncbi:DUF4365 domain-containing protein [Cupriavidus basilensis]|nr:DUF4365 domain-containing protein [Cupriavidus basilensis]